MKGIKGIIYWVLAVFCCACMGQKGTDTEKENRQMRKQLLLQEFADTLLSEQDTFPLNADKLFEDFLYLYAMEENVQRHRTIFPLPHRCAEGDSLIEKSEWIYQRIFPENEFYLMLFDNEEQMEIEKDTSINQVVLSNVDVLTEQMKNYCFIRQNGRWALKNIESCFLKSSENSDFLRFFSQFVNDSVYQNSCLEDPLTFVTVDSEDEFTIIEATINKEQWFAFAPVLPKGRLVVLDYGQKQLEKSLQKVVILKDLSGSTYQIFHFDKEGKSWKMTKYEDVSN
ncbi:MAG: DUF4348 domain-containing protein [Bacteroidaceae bacterium]|nr:DUF4348 domain-containing protein [Bacteroidaceae bacterium]